MEASWKADRVKGSHLIAFIICNFNSLSRVTRHCRTLSPSYARLATRGSGEIQIVKASDWLQELVNSLFPVNNIRFI